MGVDCRIPVLVFASPLTHKQKLLNYRYSYMMAKIIELSFSYMKKHSKTDASQFFQFQTETETETETVHGLYVMNDPSKIGRPTQ